MKFTPEIKEFLDHAGKMLIFENDEPGFVVSKLSEYMDLVRKAKYGGVTVDDVLMNKSFESVTSNQTVEKSPPEANNWQQVEEVNRELEAMAAEDFFVHLPPSEQASQQNQSHSFYRELE